MAKTLDVNRYLVVTGGIGCHQMITLVLTGLLISQFGWQMLSIIFVLKIPKFRCSEIELGNVSTLNGTTSTLNGVHEFDSKCEQFIIINNVNVSKNCTEFVYDREYGETAVERFNLVCGRAYIKPMSEMIYMIGIGVGTLGGSYFSDRYGRKMAIVVSCLIGSVVGILQAFSVNVIMYVATRVATAFFTSAFFTPAFSLMLESVSPKRRANVLNVLEIFWILGGAALSPFSYLLKDWWKIHLFGSAPGILVGVAIILLVDESPHWLASCGQVEKALKVLQNMTKAKNIDTQEFSFEASDFAQEKNGVKDGEEKESFLRVWMHKRLVIRFFIFTYAWISCALCYCVLTFGVSVLPGNLYLNNMISVAVEALGYVMCFSIAWLGRKWPTVLAFLGGSALLLITVLVKTFSPESDKVVIAMSMMGKMFVVAAWQMIIVWSNEIYPTTHRCTLVSLNIVVGRMASALAPYLILLEDYIDVPNEQVIVPILFAVMMVAGGLLHIIPPETNRRMLPETTIEANVVSFPSCSPAKDTDTDDGGKKESEYLELLEPEEKAENVKLSSTDSLRC